MRRPPLLGVLVLFGGLASAGCQLSQQIPFEAFDAVTPSHKRPLTALLRDPEDSQVIYAGCGVAGPGEGRSGSVLKSTDGGDSWMPASFGLPPGGEILALELTPPGFAGERPAILAALRGKRPYVSTNGAMHWQPLGDPEESPNAPNWSSLTIQAMTALPGQPSALALGTRESGVLISEDGGRHWHNRNRNLTNLDIKALAPRANGDLFAATWYGGIYESSDRGLNWMLVDPALDRKTIAAMTIDNADTVWAGLQNGGLLSMPRDASAFRPQGQTTMDRVPILSLASEGDLVLVGTGGRGVALGRNGEPFVLVEEGLRDTAVVTSLLSHSELLLVGTWDGLFRSRPPTIPWLTLLAVSLVTGLLGGVAYRLEQRTVSARARRMERSLAGIPLAEIPRTLSHHLASLTDGDGPELVGKLADRLERREGGALVARPLRAHVPLLHALAPKKTDAGHLASALEVRMAAVEEMRRAAEDMPDNEKMFESIDHLLARDRLYIQVLRADSPAHLTALRDSLEAARKVLSLRVRIEAVADARETGQQTDPRDEDSDSTDATFFDQLSKILGQLHAVERLTDADDRGLDLGHALTRVLALQENIERRLMAAPWFGDVIAAAVLDALRQLITRALDDLRQRAEIKAVLRTERLPEGRQSAVVLEVSNFGQGHARDLRVELFPSDGGFTAEQPVRELRSLLRRQSARLDFVLTPHTAGRLRLVFHLSWDDNERNGHERRFGASVEVSSKPETLIWRSLRPNPYVVGRPLLLEDPFYGRQELFADLRGQLEGRHQDNVVVIIGQRRMGKTSVLRRLPKVLGDRYLPVLIDLQGLLAESEEDFFHELAVIVNEQLVRQGFEQSPIEGFDENPGRAFRLFLQSWTNEDRRLLLAFDELEVLEERIREGALQPRVLQFLRSIAQHETRTSFVFAGTHRLKKLTGGYWSVFFNLATYLEVGHLTPEDHAQLFIEPTQSTFELDPLALERAYQLTGGHPHFSQLLARELVSWRNKKKLQYITVDDIRSVADQVATRGQLHIAYLWNDSSEAEIRLLAGLAEALDREGFATLSSIYRQLESRKIKTDHLERAVESLVERQILADDGSHLTFRIDLLRRWMARQTDTWQVIRKGSEVSV